ncbi:MULTISPECIES: PIG-L deacetylase family protein [Streptomyces]|uniref:PIG-L family deacetylase n=1 Tax=Streptomyces griseosporeus TaxID=1910 RepID=A0ABV3KV02_STRGS
MLGYNDARNPEAAPGQPRLVDAPLDEAVGRVGTHIRAFRPDIVVTHDAVGQLTGHLDHVRTHQITLLAVEAAGLAHLYPEAGPPWQPTALYAATHPESGVGPLRSLLEGVGKKVLTVPDSYVTTSVDVTPWADVKWAAILAHRGEVARERPLPGILARPPKPTAPRSSRSSTSPASAPPNEGRLRPVDLLTPRPHASHPFAAHEQALTDRREMPATSALDERPRPARTVRLAVAQSTVSQDPADRVVLRRSGRRSGPCRSGLRRRVRGWCSSPRERSPIRAST